MAFALALGPLGPVLGFALLPGALLAVIAALVIGYLAAAEVLKLLAARAGQPALCRLHAAGDLAR
ncbi:hypothetical protein [Falsiroseomonas sp.]|uniref:hypothetical protein n=1 Tax=Falsiroseomonas sp. TaxID=2870721 RepID=UPI0034A4162E